MTEQAAENPLQEGHGFENLDAMRTPFDGIPGELGDENSGTDWSNHHSNGFSVSRRNGGYSVWSRKRPELPMHGAITVVSLLEFSLVPAGRLKFTACLAMLISPPITERVSCVHLLPDAQPPYQA